MHSILVVDDETAVRGWIRAVLENAGYKVSEATNGHEARWHFQKDRIDLVITDIFMPDCDGIELLQESRKVCPSRKIVVISGGHDKWDFVHTAEILGANVILHKPLEERALLDAVRVLFSADTMPTNNQTAATNEYPARQNPSPS